MRCNGGVESDLRDWIKARQEVDWALSTLTKFCRFCGTSYNLQDNLRARALTCVR